ncbi:MAG: TRAP transporter permease, partial [Moorellaceae bacterium]
GAAAFIMAEYLGVGYGQIIISAAIPALLYYVALYFSIDIEARRVGLRGLPKQELPRVKDVLRSGWYLLLPLVLLIYLLVGLDFSPPRAALYGIGSIFLLQAVCRRSLKNLIPAFEEGAKAAIQVATTCALVGIIVGMIELTGLGVKLSQGLIALSGGSLPVLLLVTMAASLILGMGLPPSACYITLAILVAPTLVQMGVKPLSAHYFVFMFGIMSMITPPVAISSYVAASLAGADMFKTGWTAVRIAASSFIVPFMFVYGPQLLALGSALEVVATTLAAIVGVWAFSSGVWGWLKTGATLLERILLLGGGICLIDPGHLTDLMGAALVSAAILIHLRRLRALRSVAHGEHA